MASRSSPSRRTQSAQRKQGAVKKRAARKAPARRNPAAEGRKIGYAVIGLGHIAQEQMLPAFAHAKANSRLAALVTGDPEKARKLGKTYKVPVFRYDQLEECLKLPEVDAVYIALPNDQHLEYTERAARAGAHVLCEKPMALSSEECERMIQACKDSDVRLMIAYRLHFDPANLKILEHVRKGHIGEPRFFSSTFSYQIKQENIRLDADKGGGVLWDIGIYCVNAARMLFGEEPIEVFAHAGSKPGDPRFDETEESAAVTLKFSGGRLASFVASFGAAATARLHLVGSQGDIELENAYEYAGEMRWTVRKKKGEEKGKLKVKDQFAPELLYFSNCVLENKPVEPDGYEGLADVRVIEALYESIRTGRAIAIERFDRGQEVVPEQRIEVSGEPGEDAELVDVQAPVQE